MKLAVTLESFGQDLRSAAAEARTAGFEGVMLRLRHGQVDLAELSGSGARDLLHTLQSRGVRPIAIQHDVSPGGLTLKTDLDREISAFTRAVRTAAGLDRAMLCTDLGALPPVERTQPAAPIDPGLAGAIIIPAPAVPANPPTAGKRNPAWESTVDGVMREFASIADRQGVLVAFRASLSDFASINRTLEAAACPWFGVDLDPVAVLADDLDVDAIFSLVGPQIRHVRGRDGLRGGGNRVQVTPVGQGKVDWPMLLANLDAAGYAGFVTVDTVDLPDRPAVARRAISTLRR